MAAPSEMRRSASPRLVAPHTKGTVKGHLSMWYASSAGVSTSDSSMKSTPRRLQHLRLGEVPDAGLGHHGDRHRLDDPLDQQRVAHPRHATVPADVGRHPLERHDRDGTGVLGDLGLLGVDDVHDDAAPQHVGQPPLDGEGPGVSCAPVYEGGAAPSHHSLSAAALTDVASRSPGTMGSSRWPTDGSIHTQRVGPKREGEAKNEPPAGAGASIIVPECAEEAPRVAHRRRADDVGSILPTLPHAAAQHRLAAEEAAQRDPDARDAVVAPLHVGQLVGDHALELDGVHPAQEPGRDHQIRAPRVAAECAGVGHVVVDDVERRAC